MQLYSVALSVRNTSIRLSKAEHNQIDKLTLPIYAVTASSYVSIMECGRTLTTASYGHNIVMRYMYVHVIP